MAAKRSETPTWLIVVLLLAVVTVGLLAAGCAAADDPARFAEHLVELDDGRTVTCVAWKGRGAWGGLSCDWEGATT